MIEEFIKKCKENPTKNAFIVGRKKITYSRLLNDLYKMVNLFKSKNLKRGQSVLLFVPPSYHFYLLLFACIYYGINIVVPDSFKNNKRIADIIENHNIEYVFCNNLTSLLRFKFKKGMKYCNLSSYLKYSADYSTPNSDENLTVLTTFTSGTTGEPKPIYRNYAFFNQQINSISKNIDFESCNCVFASLPIYTLFVVYSGRTCVLSSKINEKYFSKLNIDTVIAPINAVLKAKGNFSCVKKVFLGGARIYKREATYIKNIFPLANISYIYGASECALMAITNLDYYLKNGCTLQKIADGIELSLIEKDEFSVGKIAVLGNSVISNDGKYVSNDLGLLTEKGLKIVGRAKYSHAGLYNYILDDEILSLNEKVKRGFSLVYNKKIYFCYEGRLTKKESGIIYVKFLKLPMDAKHKTKLDYSRVLKKLLLRKN